MAVAQAALLAALETAAWLSAKTPQGCLMFRHEFSLSGTPSKAIVGFAAAGYGEVWVNGAKADPTAVLEPGWTQWDTRLLVPAYDVTTQLRHGSNAIGLMLGAGWYGHMGHLPGAKLALQVEFQGNASIPMNVTSGSNWHVGLCPVTQNDIYNGEVYDARLYDPTWSQPGGAQHWQKVSSSVPPVAAAKATLSPQAMPPIRALELLPAQLVTASVSSAILDFGQNIAGWVQLQLSNCAVGASIAVRHAEFLNENRTALLVGNLRSAKATDVYICRGGRVLHEPRFTYHGFRFAEITISGDVTWSWADQHARVVHTSVQSRGSLEMKNEVLADIQKAILWTQLDNIHSVPTDCPQRDERQGWMADGSLSAEQATLNFDMREFYLNWLQVIVDSQESTYAHDCKIPIAGGGVNGTCLGAVTDTSPHIQGPAGRTFGHRPADPSWGAALPIIADLARRYYGKEAVEAFIPAVHAWADFLLTMRQGGIVKYHYYGDWLQPGKVASDNVVSEMTSAFNTLLAMKIASTFGGKAERSRFAAEYDTMRDAFEAAFWNPQISAFADGTQAPQVFALQVGGLQPEREQKALSRLLSLLETNGIGTGIISTKWLFPLLSRYEKTELGLRLASATAFPSWGFMIAKGATTIWEHWDVYHNPSGNGMSSHNHPAFTSVGAWFYTDLVGIRVDRNPI
jgi:alpha-L-rhamnosidase